MIFNKETGKPQFIATEDTWISHFKWEIFYSFSLVDLIQLCKEHGGSVTNEHNIVVFDSGRNFDFQSFKTSNI